MAGVWHLLRLISRSRRHLRLVLPPLAGALRLEPFEHGGAFVPAVPAELEVGETTRPCLPANPGLRHREELTHVTYMIPKRSKLRTFQMALDSGFAPEAGEWTLR
jgi:hypothetical protein